MNEPTLRVDPRGFRFRQWYIPDYMAESLREYILHGEPPEEYDFLDALLSGNIARAVAYADIENLPNIQAYGAWLYYYAPIYSYGSRENMNAWIKRGGLAGVLARAAFDAETERIRNGPTNEDGTIPRNEDGTFNLEGGDSRGAMDE